ncbi:hypothetical protein PHAVU_007G112200 [Phaseolus vulgaris]|uniref:Uncharacterized protein n=1 Tax=Phaseolus vulgaris TaxID=3885 RepID=V7BDI9_PHAVU|nr:hypothetical protein PHAVU_007G112200g [Phaseolus vulgaris]ESW15899.1 hypothetical protein PHAVU_007G112200g [Phaseolus vulgaris]
MAAELVGGALLSAFLQFAFDRLASPQVVDFFRRRKLDEQLLGNLNIMLHSINAVADDAELRQFTDPHVKAWLLAVKEAVFDAEDLLGEIDYELTRCQVEAQSQPQTFTYKKIESGMKEVLEKLEYLAKQMGALGLKKGTYSGDGSGSKVPSSSLVVESPSILSIVGMGGLGKTTLAQHVYNDPKIEDAKFDIKAWVCVLDNFHVLTLTKTILEAITDRNDDSENLEMVHKKLKEKLSGKKFLLVLDDVWNQRQDEWEVVRTPLTYGATGSRILVTTRDEKVASNMQYKVHHLKQLQEDECWKVFTKHASKDDNLELNDEQKEIVRKIVEKFKGLPLALKTIGCLLCSKSSILDWKSILESDIWNLPKEESEIIPALLLSYHYIPSHLKRCFAYCALFPKDYEFVKEKLILLWMTQNFLGCPQQVRHPEEVGEQYFNDLLSRLKFDKGKCIPKTTHHFSFALDDVKCFDGFGSLTDAKRLRSFISITEIGRTCIGCYPWEFKISIHDVFSKFKFLRVISFYSCLDLVEVPDSIGNLKHLQSLDLLKTGIQKLPDSTCLLYNLLILKLNFCGYRKELPLNLHKLTKLRCLEFKNTKVTKLPMDLGELKNLRELQNIMNSWEALAVDLKNKTHLVRLKLKWNKNHIPNDPRKEKELLGILQPSKHLERLSVRNYRGTKLPSWIFDNSLSNLVFLRLEDCKYCLCLPPLGLLSSLKTLKIRQLDGIVSIGAEFYGTNSSFTSLERLEFFNMKEWEEWECETTSFPRLQHLSADQCPKLKGLSEQLLHLKKLFICHCDKLIISGMDTSSLELLEIVSCPLVNVPMTH